MQAKGLVNEISKSVPSYWANNALSASVDIVQLNLTSDVDLQSRWISNSSNVFNSIVFVSLFSLIFTVVTLVKVHRSR